VKDFELNERYIHFSKPHIVCHNCETFYCERNIYFNKKETNEWKVPAFTECKKTTFISMFQKHIFNRIQEKISISEVEVLDKLNENFDAEREYLILINEICTVNKVKKYNENYIKRSKESKEWKHSLNH
jgi:hypothetical protein